MRKPGPRIERCLAPVVFTARPLAIPHCDVFVSFRVVAGDCCIGGFRVDAQLRAQLNAITASDIGPSPCTPNCIRKVAAAGPIPKIGAAFRAAHPLVIVAAVPVAARALVDAAVVVVTLLQDAHARLDLNAPRLKRDEAVCRKRGLATGGQRVHADAGSEAGAPVALI